MPNKDPVKQAFTDFQDTVNMTASELEAWEDSDNRDIYLKQKSGGQPAGEPLADVQRLVDTPKSEWRDKDDGFNEVEEAREVTAFVARMSAAEQGDAMPDSDPALSKRDASLLEWGFDASEGSSDFVGDRQR